MAKLALEGIRVIDHGVVWAVPHCGMLLANMGAEVIKVESIQYYDSIRGEIAPPLTAETALQLGIVLPYPEGEPGERPWERHPYFHSTNSSKMGLTLDLSRPKGREVYRQLVEKSDVVIEGFSHGTMEDLGITYEVLRSWKPDIIYASAPGYGTGGPESDYVAYGTNQWHMGGMAAVSGYPGEGPMQASNTYGDPLAGWHIAGFVLAALLHRRRTGKGQFIDVSQTEPSLCCLGEVILDYVMNDRTAERKGNRHPFHAPHGCYPCHGEDMWVTVAVTSDQEWNALCSAIGRPELATDERFGDSLSRWQNQDELDRLIADWTGTRERYEVMCLLQGVGVAATPVLGVDSIHDNPQHKARGYYEMVTHPYAGTHLYRNVGYRMSKTPGHIMRPPPCLGEHNDYILGTILGISQEEIAELEREQYIGTMPLPGADGQPVGK